MKSKKKPPACDFCGETFDNVFEWTDHALEDDEEYFNPALILPTGYKLMVGAFLRYIYGINDVNKVKEAAESVYLTLWLAENQPSKVDKNILDMVVSTSMDNFDEELKKIGRAHV